MNKQKRLQMMHFAYQVATQRQVYKEKANFLYASLFADLKKVIIQFHFQNLIQKQHYIILDRRSKKVIDIESIRQDKSSKKISTKNKIYLQLYLIKSFLTLLDMNHICYQVQLILRTNILAQSIITKDNLQFWATKIDEYELQPLHILPKDQLTLDSDKDLQQFHSMIDGNIPEQYSSAEEDNSEEDLGDDSDYDELQIEELEKRLSWVEKQILKTHKDDKM